MISEQKSWYPRLATKVLNNQVFRTQTALGRKVASKIILHSVDKSPEEIKVWRQKHFMDINAEE